MEDVKEKERSDQFIPSLKRGKEEGNARWDGAILLSLT